MIASAIRRRLLPQARSLRLFVYGMLAASPVYMTAISAEKPADAVTKKVLVLNIKGAIGPVTDDYVKSGLARARDMQASLVVLRMDTPGGLDTSMREIIKAIIASPIPVATYVAPSGARAASAGTYIFYASHVAAMAPGTNLGAATPVRIGGNESPAGDEPEKPKTKGKSDKNKKATKAAPLGDDAMAHKVVNDAVAYIKGLAQMRGRNGEWAEKAVREAASLHAEEAVRLKVADFVATDMNDLLSKLEGRRVTVEGKEISLALKGAELAPFEPDWRVKLLSVITDPNVAYLLMSLGTLGLVFELANPGYVLPGVVGGICLLLGLYAFQALPVNYAGLGLILLGMAFMVAEAFMPSFGALGIGGIVAFVVGSIILLDTGVEGYDIAWQLITLVAVVASAILFGVVTLALRARQRRVVSGEYMHGVRGEALESFTGRGRVRVRGEEWQAHSRARVAKGQSVRVARREGLLLHVEPEPKEDN